jgi:hypothetical protein
MATAAEMTLNLNVNEEDLIAKMYGKMEKEIGNISRLLKDSNSSLDLEKDFKEKIMMKNNKYVCYHSTNSGWLLR